MIQVTYFDNSNGRIVGCAVCSKEDAELNLPKNCSMLEGLIDGSEFYIQNNVAVKIPEKLEKYSEFDFEAKQWVNTETFDVSCQIVKNNRNTLLQQSDWTQIQNNPLTEDQQMNWSIYRQELRDVTLQSGYPFNVVWPTPPQG